MASKGVTYVTSFPSRTSFSAMPMPVKYISQS